MLCMPFGTTVSSASLPFRLARLRLDSWLRSIAWTTDLNSHKSGLALDWTECLRLHAFAILILHTLSV